MTLNNQTNDNFKKCFTISNNLEEIICVRQIFQDKKNWNWSWLSDQEEKHVSA